MHSLQQVIITSLLEDKQTFKHGGEVEYVHCVANGFEEQKERKKKKRKREKKKNKMNDDEKLLGSFSFIKLQVL